MKLILQLVKLKIVNEKETRGSVRVAFLAEISKVAL